MGWIRRDDDNVRSGVGDDDDGVTKLDTEAAVANAAATDLHWLLCSTLRNIIE